MWRPINGSQVKPQSLAKGKRPSISCHQECRLTRIYQALRIVLGFAVGWELWVDASATNSLH